MNGALQPRDAAALLIDADPQRQLAAPAPAPRATISATCSGVVDVAGEEDDAAEIELARERAHLGGNGVAGEAGDRQLTDVPADLAGIIARRL